MQWLHLSLSLSPFFFHKYKLIISQNINKEYLSLGKILNLFTIKIITPVVVLIIIKQVINFILYQKIVFFWTGKQLPTNQLKRIYNFGLGSDSDTSLYELFCLGMQGWIESIGPGLILLTLPSGINQIRSLMMNGRS